MVLSILLQAEATGQQGGSMFSGIAMMVVLFAIMYFFMIRPQQKKQKEIEKQRNALTTGDRVVTSGGIHGKLKEINDTDYVVEIADGVKIKVEKTAVFAAASDARK
ncbi:MAG: preprotein translocase subunit YajC [Candidatus Symbiothrix sp.]|jgi:preprotein translocase subunit YajC|nr:preprotein translocase subunit YajC [Candidatus Symbiothrix sp.]